MPRVLLHHVHEDPAELDAPAVVSISLAEVVKGSGCDHRVAVTALLVPRPESLFGVSGLNVELTLGGFVRRVAQRHVLAGEEHPEPPAFAVCHVAYQAH